MLRIAVGLEDAEDLCQDLAQALATHLTEAFMSEHHAKIIVAAHEPGLHLSDLQPRA